MLHGSLVTCSNSLDTQITLSHADFSFSPYGGYFGRRYILSFMLLIVI
jgi:hypothetical protein